MLTECIQNYDHDHNQNYVNANHAHNQNHTHSQNNMALAGKTLGVVIIQIMYTTSQNHSHSLNYAHSQIHAHMQNYARNQKACTQLKSMLTECIQNYDHDHNQNYINANHAHDQNHERSQNNVALAAKKLRVLIIRIM